MKEIKDDAWTDWLLNNKHSRKLSKRTKWSPLTIIIIGILLIVAVFYASLLICYQGFIYYANTILPFHFPLSWYLLGVAIDGELGKHFLLYTHKGLFGWYVADDLREIE